MADIKISNLIKAYGAVQILKNINLDITSGEFVVFVGPSGCGKSTLLRTISGLESITSGELQIDGQVVNEVPPSKRGIAMVFQSYALYPHMSVYENIAFTLENAGIPRDQIRQKVEKVAEMLQLTPISDPLAEEPVRRPAPARGDRARDRAGIPRSSCSTNRSRTSMRPCAFRPASRSPAQEVASEHDHDLCDA